MACHLAAPGRLTRPYLVALRARDGWHRAHVVGTTSSWPVAPSHAQVLCESRDRPDDPWVSRGPEAPEQGRRSSDVLTCPGEVWQGFVILDDPSVHVAGHGVRMPTVSMALDLSFELHAF